MEIVAMCIDPSFSPTMAIMGDIRTGTDTSGIYRHPARTMPMSISQSFSLTMEDMTAANMATMGAMPMAISQPYSLTMESIRATNMAAMGAMPMTISQPLNLTMNGIRAASVAAMGAMPMIISQPLSLVMGGITGANMAAIIIADNFSFQNGIVRGGVER